MIDLLVDRLRWPAPLARERAATQIAQMMADGREDAIEALMRWIGRQELESRAATGLLPFLRAVAMTGTQPVPTHELAKACIAGSFLYDLFLSHYHPSYAGNPHSPRHSGSPPAGWRQSNEYKTTPGIGLESGMFNELNNVDRHFRSSLAQQFQFELSVLQKEHGESPTRALSLWGTPQHAYHPGWSPLSGELCISAYLRAIAWGSENHDIPQELIPDLAAFASPVDLRLWGVKATSKPNWWPNLGMDCVTSPIEAQIAAVFQGVADSAEAWATGPNIVLAASGCLSQTNLSQHDLEVRTFLQAADGPSRPTSQQVFECLSTIRSRVVDKPSPLHFEGRVLIEDTGHWLEDWFIVPCSGTAHPIPMMSWQAWRGIREIQCPLPALADERIHATCRQSYVSYESKDGLVARWSDWTDGLSALAIMGLPPASGWVLTAPRETVERFSAATGMRLSWVWEIKSHFRDQPYEEFMEYQQYGERGTSALAIPLHQRVRP